MTEFSHKILVALIIFVGGLQLVNTLAVGGPPPDVSAVIKLKSILTDKKRSMLYCVTGDNTSTITTHNLRDSRYNALRFTGPAVNRTAEHNADGGWWPFGVVCRQMGNHHTNYNVTIPLRYHNESRTPTKLSYTLDPDQDLVIDTIDQNLNLTNLRWWKLGGSVSQFTNISNGRLTIPHQQLDDDAGIYRLSSYGSMFSLFVRECPSGRYGPPDCTKDCPGCMNGGMCHPQTGYCVCPPGVMGSLCQTRCPLNMIGKDCTVRVPYTAGVAVCVPHPVGCTCLPGYQGTWCEEECNNGHFGADCQGDCECSEDDCDKATVFCNQEVPANTTASGLSPSATAPTIELTWIEVPANTTAPGLSPSATAPTIESTWIVPANTTAPGLPPSATAPTIESTWIETVEGIVSVAASVVSVVGAIVGVIVWWRKKCLAQRPTENMPLQQMAENSNTQALQVVNIINSNIMDSNIINN